MTMVDDLGRQCQEIKWPDGFAPNRADLFAHNEIDINANCKRVWSFIIVAAKWPSWYPNSSDVVLADGAETLTLHAAFRWTTFGLTIDSRVHELIAGERLGWFGLGNNGEPHFAIAWLLTDRGDGCRVVLEETGVGSTAKHFRDTDEQALNRSHEIWLAGLKRVAEGAWA